MGSRRLVPRAFLASALLLGGCSHEAELAPDSEVHLRLVRTYDTESAGLSEVSEGVLTSSHEAVVLDATGRQLVAFRGSGQVHWIRETRGEGPGDLRWPTGLALAGDSVLYLLNQAGTRVDAITLDGTLAFTRSLPFNGRADRLKVSGDGLLIFGTPTFGDFSLQLLGVDPVSWSVRDSILLEIDGPPGHPEIGMKGAWSLAHGSVFAADVDEYRFVSAGMTGSSGPEIGRPEIRMTPPHIGTSSLGPQYQVFSQLFAPVPLSGGALLAGGWWPTKPFVPQSVVARPIDRTESLDYFDQDGIRTGVQPKNLGVQSLLASDGHSQVLMWMGDGTLQRHEVTFIEGEYD